jgi:hypothetical protein
MSFRVEHICIYAPSGLESPLAEPRHILALPKRYPRSNFSRVHTGRRTSLRGFNKDFIFRTYIYFCS